jgi:hypothetical protein
MPTTRSRSRASVAELAQRSQRDPVWWVETVLGVELWTAQRRIMRSVRDHRQTAVRSCHGPGKTLTAAATVLWFLCCFPDSRVVTTATKWSQVKNLLWHEVNRLYKGARVDGGLGGTCLQTQLYLPDGRYALGLSTRPGQEESFQGHHAPHILLLYDEASGVPEAVYEAGEGYMTTEGARKLLIGNPTRAEGEFYRAFHSDRASYATHHISAFDTPAFTGEAISEDVLARLVSRQWVEERRKWEGTALWDVKVLGDFSKRSDDTVMSLGLIEDAQGREVRPPAPDREAVVACDVARFGSDETVISTLEGSEVEIVDTYQGQDTVHTTGRVRQEYDRLRQGRGSARVVVDDTGVGGGVTDQLRAQGVPVTAFNGAESPIDPELYPNARSEAWFRGAEVLERMSIPEDEQLAADLLAPKYKLDSQGRRVVEPKEETKKRLGRSPDRGDSVLLLFTPPRESGMEVW